MKFIKNLFAKLVGRKKIFRDALIVVVVLFIVQFILTVVLIGKVSDLKANIINYQTKETQMLNQIYGRTWTIQSAMEGIK